MKPEIVKKLMEYPLMAEFSRYLTQEINDINTFDDIRLDDPTEIAIEVKARMRAREKMLVILEGLVVLPGLGKSTQK